MKKSRAIMYLCGIEEFFYGLLLTFYAKSCILKANAKIFRFKTSQRVEEECLKSKMAEMAEKYDWNITMTVCQIGNLCKYIRRWFQFPLHFAYHPLKMPLPLMLKLKSVKVTVLKKEVI